MSFILSKFAESNALYNKTLLQNKRDESFSFSNPTILWDNRLFVNFRCINYIPYVSKTEKYAKNINGWISSGNVSSDNCLSNVPSSFYKDVNIDKNTNHIYNGLEDAIFIKWNNKKYLCGTRCDIIENKSVICIYEFDNFLNICKEIIINDDRLNRVEKHWSPIEDMPFTFIRWHNPTEIIEVDENSGIIKNIIKKNTSNLVCENIRGNCQTIKYKDGYLTIAHNTKYYTSKDDKIFPVYSHYFVQYDRNFEIKRVSKPFSFDTEDIEFCCGIQYNRNKIYISYSVYDTIPFILEFGEDLLEDILNGISTDDINEEYSADALYNKANSLLINNQYYSAAACYSRIFSSISSTELEFNSLMKFCICLLAVKYKGNNIFSDETILSFIDNLMLLNENKAEPYYLLSVYYGLCGDLNKKDIFKKMSYQYRFEFPEIKRYLKIW